jgi:hypothetical protein
LTQKLQIQIYKKNLQTLKLGQRLQLLPENIPGQVDEREKAGEYDEQRQEYLILERKLVLLLVPKVNDKR